MKRLVVVQHVPYEGLGTFETVFRQAGCSLRTLNAADPKVRWPSVDSFDGLVVMGGPMGVYEQAKHPFLKKEIALLQQALNARLPVLGVCLGAQLLAAALGAKVTRNPQKEIGWYPVMREPDADGDPLCEPFGQTETVFQWHGDTFTLPKGAVRLASSPLCAESLASGSGFHPESSRRMEQAFRYGDLAYGLQFHVEVTDAMIRSWLTVNKRELSSLKGVIDPDAIRSQTPQHLARLQELSGHVATTFGELVKSAAHASRRPIHAR